MKRQLIAGFVILFGLWPLVQYGAVVRYGVDPWKLFGYGMYSVPGPMKTLRLVGETSTGEIFPIDPTTYSTEERRAATRFFEHRRALGRLATPEALIEVVLDERPQFATVIMVLFELELDRDTAMLVGSIENRRFYPDGRSEIVDLKKLRLDR